MGTGAEKTIRYRKLQAQLHISHFALGVAYYALLPTIHTLIWTFYVLPSTTALLTTICAAVAISQVYFVWQFIRHSDYYVKRISQIGETLQDHWQSEKKRLTQYVSIYLSLSVLAAIASLIVKEVLQDLSGQLISFSYLSLPILFTALAITAVLTVYFAVKPMLKDEHQKPHILAKIGSYLFDAVLTASLAAGCSYCFAIFYAPFLPNFSIFMLPTTLSIVAIGAIAGAFVHVFVYISNDKENAAASFQTIFLHLFQRENSLRRIITCVRTLVANILWGGIAAAALFSALYFLPFPLLPTLSPMVFIHTLPWIILASMVTQTAVGLFDSAVTKPEYREEASTMLAGGFVPTEETDSKHTEDPDPERSSAPSAAPQGSS